MRTTLSRPLGWSAALGLALAGGLFCFNAPAVADEPKPADSTDARAYVPKEKDVPTYDLFDAVDKGLVTVSAEGDGKGRMTLSVKNRSKTQLRVILPPGLIASGVSGQFGGMGG